MAPNSLITNDRLAVLARFASRTANLPGEMAELGVYRGGSARVICEAAGNGKKLHLFDTFKGLPLDGGSHLKGEFAAKRRDVEVYLSGCNVEFHEGEFPYSVIGCYHIYSEVFSFVHIDADLFESTRCAIAFFLPRMVPGGVMIFDDVHWTSTPGVDQALKEAGLMDRLEFHAEYQGVFII